MTTTRSLLLVAVICGLILSCAFASAVPLTGTTQVSSADLIRGQAGNANGGNSPNNPGLGIPHQQVAAIKPIFSANFSPIRLSPVEGGTAVFSNLTRWETPLMSPVSSATGTGFTATGTVTWLPMEGGFFGIITDDGKRYDPLNLPAEYAKDGMRVGFTAKTDPDMASFHMWGTIVSIIDIQPISQDGSYNQSVFVHYERYGGLAGFEDKLTIYENRTATVTTRAGEKTFTITPSEKADLVSLFDSSGFDSVNQGDLPDTLGIEADYFEYVIEFRGHKIEAPELAIPESVHPVIDALNEMVGNEMTSLPQDGTTSQDVFVHYERSGGIAGFDDKLTIYENRTAVVNTRNGGGKTFTITPSEKDDLVSLFDSTGFDSVNQEDLPMYKIAAGADLFNYVIEFRGHSIHAIELAIPDSIRPVIDALDGIVRNGE
jgi:hypothetical protein